MLKMLTLHFHSSDQKNPQGYTPHIPPSTRAISWPYSMGEYLDIALESVIYSKGVALMPQVDIRIRRPLMPMLQLRIKSNTIP